MLFLTPYTLFSSSRIALYPLVMPYIEPYILMRTDWQAYFFFLPSSCMTSCLNIGEYFV